MQDRVAESVFYDEMFRRNPKNEHITPGNLASGTPLVVFGDDWGRHVSSMQHLFRHVVPRYPVIWVNSIGHRVPSLSVADLRRVWEKTLGRSQGNVDRHPSTLARPAPRVIIEPRVIPLHKYRTVLAFNTWSLVRDIRKALHKLESHHRPILITGSPPSVNVVGRLGESASVYFCMDEFLQLPGVSADMIGPLEQRLLRRVDAVIATAEKLTRTKQPRSGRVYHLPQGVTFTHFAKRRPEPSDLRRLPRPRLGFAGGVSACVDVSLLSRLSREFRTGSVVLVGPVSIDVAQLDLPNIHVLGPKSYDQLPAYVQGFDVGIIPYLLNEWTEAVDPLKLLEYLAAGIPAVSTPLPEVEKYSNTVSIASGGDAFVAAVKEVLLRDSDLVRRTGQDLAAQHTWERRAATFLDIVADLVGEHAEPLASQAG